MAAMRKLAELTLQQLFDWAAIELVEDSGKQRASDGSAWQAHCLKLPDLFHRSIYALLFTLAQVAVQLQPATGTLVVGTQVCNMSQHLRASMPCAGAAVR